MRVQKPTQRAAGGPLLTTDGQGGEMNHTQIPRVMFKRGGVRHFCPYCNVGFTRSNNRNRHAALSCLRSPNKQKAAGILLLGGGQPRAPAAAPTVGAAGAAAAAPPSAGRQHDNAGLDSAGDRPLGVQLWRCRDCAYTSKHYYNLKRHAERMHSAEGALRRMNRQPATRTSLA